jgi:hypothetical protein
MKKSLLAFGLALGFGLACGPVTPISGITGLTFTSDGGHADAGTHDAGSNTQNDAGNNYYDAGNNTQSDAGNTTQLNCGDIITCINACGTDQTCAQNCFSQGTTHAQSLFQTAANCLGTACPQSGVCATQTTACDNCYSAAQMSGGACYSDVQACGNDNGSTTTTDAGNNTGGTGCSEIITCVNACTTQSCFNGCVSSGSTAAQGLFTDLDDCISTACPSTTGSPCATASSSACTTCVQNSQGMTGACYSQLQACGASQ